MNFVKTKLALDRSAELRIAVEKSTPIKLFPEKFDSLKSALTNQTDLL